MHISMMHVIRKPVSATAFQILIKCCIRINWKISPHIVLKLTNAFNFNLYSSPKKEFSLLFFQTKICEIVLWTTAQESIDYNNNNTYIDTNIFFLKLSVPQKPYLKKNYLFKSFVEMIHDTLWLIIIFYILLFLYHGPWK